MTIKLCLFLFTLLMPVIATCATNNQEFINQWQEDIDVLQQQLEARHINLYHKISKQEFTQQLTQIKTELHKWSPTQLRVQLMRVVKQVGDGHTQFAYWGGEHHCYPIELRVFGKDIRLIGVTQEHQNLLGATLVAIEDMPIEQLLTLIIPILQGVENPQSEQQRLIDTIRVAEILQGLKISKSLEHTKFTFKLPNGKLQSVTLNSISSEHFAKHKLSSLKPALPTNFTKHKISIEGIDLLLNHNDQIAYLNFHHYPSSSEMKDFADNLIALLRERKTRNVIIDLRNNGGGDFFVGLRLAWAFIMIDNLNWRDGIYVLTGRKTFSAAMSNAAQYRQLLNATLVGEPTGANPVGYQDADTFKLPNSGWKIMHSKRLYRFQDQPSAGVQPDIYLPEDWNSFAQGKDNQLQWILDKIQQ